MPQINSEISNQSVRCSSWNKMNVLKTCSCRFVLVLCGIFFVYIVSYINKDNTSRANYFGLLVFTPIILIDTAYICIKRNGVDYKWFADSSFDI